MLSMGMIEKNVQSQQPGSFKFHLTFVSLLSSKTKTGFIKYGCQYLLKSFTDLRLIIRQ
jgi:hypothetical protein